MSSGGFAVESNPVQRVTNAPLHRQSFEAFGCVAGCCRAVHGLRISHGLVLRAARLPCKEAPRVQLPTGPPEREWSRGWASAFQADEAGSSPASRSTYLGRALMAL